MITRKYNNSMIIYFVVIFTGLLLWAFMTTPAHASDFLTKTLESGDRVVLSSGQCQFPGWEDKQAMYVEYRKGHKPKMNFGCYTMMGNKAIIVGPVVGPYRRWILNIDDTFSLEHSQNGGGIF